MIFFEFFEFFFFSVVVVLVLFIFNVFFNVVIFVFYGFVCVSDVNELSWFGIWFVVIVIDLVFIDYGRILVFFV